MIVASREPRTSVNLRAYARSSASGRGVDPTIFERQIDAESGFDPDAFNPTSGARGIAQFMPGTAEWVAGRIGVRLDDFWADPKLQLDGASWYDRWLLDRYANNYCKALAGYNAGPGNVDQYGGVPPFPETHRYLEKILGSDWPRRCTLGQPGVLRFRVVNTGSTLRIRARPATNAPIVKHVPDGAVLDGEAHAWRKVREPAGAEGWAANTFLALDGDRYRVVNTEGQGLRLRASPGAQAPIVKLLAEGTLLQGDEHAWRAVRDPGDGAEGWAADTFLARVTPAIHDEEVLRGRYLTPAARAPRADREALRLRYDPDTSIELQVQDWVCAIRTATWMLRSIGQEVTAGQMQDEMVPRYVTPDDGLLDARGAGLAEALSHHGVQAGWDGSATWDEVLARAGRQPLALGGRHWGGPGPGTGHWVAVRRPNAAGGLDLMNPGGWGPKFGGQTLTRAQFDQKGPHSIVWIEVDGGAPDGNFRVTVDNLRLREIPSLEGAVVKSLAAGTLVQGDEHAWRSVRDPDGAVGWAADTFLAREGTGYRVVNTEGLGVRLREAPSVQAAVKKVIPEGALVDGDEHAWRSVREPQGATGWVSNTFLAAV